MGYKTYACPWEKRCGACEWLSVPYPIQLERKRAMLQELFAQYDAEVEAPLGMERPLAYRAKVMTPYKRGSRGGIVFGMYERGTHDIVQVRECLVEYPEGRAVLSTIAELARSERIAPYDEDSGRGLLRHAIVRVARKTGQVMVTIVVNRKEFPRKKAFVAALRERHPEIDTVVFNVNARQTNAVLGPVAMTAFGQGWIEDEACGCTFRIPALAFYQTNPAAMETLYTAAVELAELERGQVVLDAYCGIGTIGIIAAKRTRARLVGVESIPAAVAMARVNARLNRIADAEFVEGDAGAYLERLASRAQDAGRIVERVLSGELVPDVVFMDPPRSGATDEFLQALLQLAPARIVYVSCNPKTQARDIAALSAAYRVERIVPVDMFPHTKHIETVCSMSHL